MVQEVPVDNEAERGPAPGPGPPPPRALLARGPVRLWGLVLTDAGAPTATVYNGLNTGGRVVMGVRAVGGVQETVSVLLTKPLLFSNGLYVDLSGTGDFCLG